MQWMKSFGLRSDGELVRDKVDTFDFGLDPPASAALLLPAV